MLPADLYETLQKLAGKTYLFEEFVEDMRKFRDNKSKLGKKEFSPETLASAVYNIFREYSKAHPDKPRFSPHALRRRGITLAVTATQSVDAAATAIGVTPQTAKANYLNKERAFNSDALFSKFGNVLRMPSGAQNGDQKVTNKTEQVGTTGNNGQQ